MLFADFFQTLSTYYDFSKLSLFLFHSIPFLFVFSTLDRKYPFLSTFGPKNKFTFLSWNLEARLTEYVKFDGDVNFFCWTPKILLRNLEQNFKIVCLRFSLLPRVIRVFGIRCSPWDSTRILEYDGKFVDKKCYIPKFWKFHAKYEFRCYHLWFGQVWCALYTEQHGTCPIFEKMYKISWTNNLFYGMVMKSMLLKNKLNWGKKRVKT